MYSADSRKFPGLPRCIPFRTESFRQGPHLHVDPCHTEVLRRSSAGSANDTRCMGVIHDETGPVVLLQCRQSGQRTNIPIHAEYAVRHNEALPFAGTVCSSLSRSAISLCL